MNNIIILTSYASGEAVQYTFGDNSYYGGSLTDSIENSLIGENLSNDTMTVQIVNAEEHNSPLIDEDGEGLSDENSEILYARGNYHDVDFGSCVPYKDTMTVYVGNNISGKYYVKSVAKAGQRGAWSFECVSLMGLLYRQKDYGGIIEGQTVGSLISALMSGYDYSIDSDLASLTLAGYLPISNRRDNLKQVLFACGASILKDENGNVLFSFNLPSTASVKSVSDVYAGSQRISVAPATVVNLTEHTYYASADTEDDVVFDNTEDQQPADHALVELSDPYHSFAATGITIDQQHANYIVVSGTGSVKAKKYVHMKKILSKQTGLGSDVNDVNITDATLIGQNNSGLSLDRITAYYSQTAEISANVVTTTERPGSILSIPDPDDFSRQTIGYIKTMQRVFSKITKSQVRLTQGWVPRYVGNEYDSFAIVRNSDLVGGVWTVPNVMRGKRAKLVLVGGSQGGQGGAAGECSGVVRGRGAVDVPGETYYQFVGVPGDAGEGGEGGAGGSGGALGKALTAEIQSLSSSYNVSFGIGGGGGSGGTVTRSGISSPVITEPEFGSYGTNSVFGSYNSANGQVHNALVNIVTGEVLAASGNTGCSGGSGGAGGNAKTYGTELPSSYGLGGNGNAAGSGAGGAGAAGSYLRIAGGNYYPIASGGGGGGGADGANGSNGLTANILNPHVRVDDDVEYYAITGGKRYNGIVESSNGGNGASAVTVPTQALMGGGKGGAGGGGGGGAGAQNGNSTWESLLPYPYVEIGIGIGGIGGNGASGGQGADGWAIIYYKA